MLVAYCGSGYFGLQIQSDPLLRTIEGDFHKALENSGLFIICVVFGIVFVLKEELETRYGVLI